MLGLTGFVPCLALPSKGSHLRKRSRLNDSIHFALPRRAIMQTRMIVETESSRSSAFRAGVEAVIEDFLRPGMNVCIGGGVHPQRELLLDSFELATEAGTLIDVAFSSTSEEMDRLQNRNFPVDLSINLKGGIDLFIAPIRVMDKNCNAVFDSGSFAADKFAASIATKVILLIHEADFEMSKEGIRSLPVQLVDFLSEEAARLLCCPPLIDFGARGATLRNDGSSVADLSLSFSSNLHVLEAQLQKLPQVLGTGLLPASKRTLAVVAASEDEPFDVTPSLSTMASLDESTRCTALAGNLREAALEALRGKWGVKNKDPHEVLSKRFKFTTVEQAEAFVQYIHYVSHEVGGCTPKISCFKRTVEVELGTEGTRGITKLDVMLANELFISHASM